MIAVNILDFILFEEMEHCPIVFEMKEKSTSIPLDEGPKYYFIEMPKMSGMEISLRSEFYRWLIFLKHDDKEELFEEVLKMVQHIRKAEERLNEIHNNPEAKALYDARFKQITDEANRIHSAKIEERQSILEQLLRQDVSDEVILACGFTTQEINEIRKKIQ